MPIYEATYFKEDENLWECGYVIWDHHAELDRETLATKMEEARKLPPYFERITWSKDEFQHSQYQRRDIFFSGGRGHWPRNGLDFSRITGLTEEDQENLIYWWSNYDIRQRIIPFARKMNGLTLKEAESKKEEESK